MASSAFTAVQSREASRRARRDARERGRIQLFGAAFRGDLAAVARLIDDGVDVDEGVARFVHPFWRRLNDSDSEIA